MMLNSISTQQTCKAANRAVNCSLPGPKGFATNPDIAGIGVRFSSAFVDIPAANTTQVVYSYELTALLTLIFASLLMLVDFYDLFSSKSRYDRLEEKQQ